MGRFHFLSGGRLIAVLKLVCYQEQGWGQESFGSKGSVLLAKDLKEHILEQNYLVLGCSAHPKYLSFWKNGGILLTRTVFI